MTVVVDPVALTLVWDIDTTSQTSWVLSGRNTVAPPPVVDAVTIFIVPTIGPLVLWVFVTWPIVLIFSSASKFRPSKYIWFLTWSICSTVTIVVGALSPVRPLLACGGPTVTELSCSTTFFVVVPVWPPASKAIWSPLASLHKTCDLIYSLGSH